VELESLKRVALPHEIEPDDVKFQQFNSKAKERSSVTDINLLNPIIANDVKEESKHQNLVMKGTEAASGTQKNDETEIAAIALLLVNPDFAVHHAVSD